MKLKNFVKKYAQSLERKLFMIPVIIMIIATSMKAVVIIIKIVENINANVFQKIIKANV